MNWGARRCVWRERQAAVCAQWHTSSKSGHLAPGSAAIRLCMGMVRALAMEPAMVLYNEATRPHRAPGVSGRLLLRRAGQVRRFPSRMTA
jgi:hypothetical protein